MGPEPPPTGARLDRAAGLRHKAPGSSLILIGLGVLSVFLYLSFALATKGTPLALPLFPFRKGVIPDFLVHFYLLFALYLGSVWSVFRGRADGRAVAITLIGFSVAFRITLLWTQPVLSDDIYRYVWDGKVQAAGINPYLYSPESPQLSHLRDDTVYPQINRPWARTIYPPGAQRLFRGIYAAKPDSLIFMKATIAACDLLTILLLIRLLRVAGLPPGRAIVYAWHPLAVFELAGSGHLDGLMIPFVLLCLLLLERRRDGWAGAALGAAAAIKLYPALLIPAVVRRHGPRLLLPAAILVGLLYLSYVWTAGPRVLGFLPQYLSDPEERFNSGPGALLAYGVGLLTPYPAQVAYGALALALLAVSLRGTKTHDRSLDATIAEVLLLFGTFVTFAQTVHPWYLLWVLPFLAIRPRACWLYLSGAIAISYVKYTDEHLRMPLWAGILEYLPFYLLALAAVRAERIRQVGARLLGQLASRRSS
jgi:alpha-1,6-mannosyltransferase